MNAAISPFHLSVRSLVTGTVIHSTVILGLTFLFCWGVGAYTLREATDMLMTIAFCYTLLGLTIWIGRALRFFFYTEHFTNGFLATVNDRTTLAPRRRGLLLVFFENQLFLPWVVIGLLLLFVAILFGVILTAQFPPDTVLTFLVRQDLNPLLKPGGLYR